MKFRLFTFTISLVAVMLSCCLPSYAIDLPSYGKWDRNVIRSDTTITLTGDVALRGTITVKSGCTLTIKNDTYVDYNNEEATYKRIYATSKMETVDGVSVSTFVGEGFNFNKNRISMFLVEEGATLRIIGKDQNARVVLNGGSGGTEDRVKNGNYLERLTTDGKHPILNGGAICTVGTVEMENCVIENVYSEFQGGAILVPAVSEESIKTGPITLTNCTIKDCIAGHGAAIMLKNQNASLNTDPEECAVTLNDVTIHHCWATNTNEKGEYVTTGGGGIIRSNGNVVSNLILNNVEIKYCRSECHGAGVYWNGHGHANTVCKIDNGNFIYNNAAKCGGTMVLEASFEFIGNKTDVENNIAGTYGGGMYIMAYNGNAGGSQISHLSMLMNDRLNILSNSAQYGGGVSFNLGDNVTLAAGSTIAVNIDGAKISGNTASIDGGGIHFYNEIQATKDIGISFNLNSGTIDGNTAVANGGGILCSYKDATDIEKAELNFNSGTISGNTAVDGGGVYIDRQTINCLDVGDMMYVTGNAATNEGGGLYISNGGSLVMNSSIISSNTAYRGGGICIKEGTFTINEGEITSNTSTEYGGGLYVSNSTGAAVTVSGGTFSKNNALAGGGICVSGAHLIMGDGVIERNTAENGGGFYLCGKAQLDFGNGIIRNNHADAGSKEQTFQTGYMTEEKDLAGMGGGIFLDTDTRLIFTEDANLGLYSNMADYGADDIFANGNSTSITLPDVTKMQLTDFDTPTDDLFWAEDYVAKDSKYTEGTFINTTYTAGGILPERYREAQSLYHEIYKVPGGQTLTGYTCLALGYGVLFITIQKSGLKEGDSAIFRIAKSDTPDVAFRTIILTGNAEGTPVSKKVALNSGTWIVTETDWSWSYNISSKSITKPIKYTSTEDELIFSFENTEDPYAALHDEAIVVNTFE